MNVSKINYHPQINNNYNKRNQSVSFKAGEGKAFVNLLEENKGKLSQEQLDGFIKDNFSNITPNSIKELLGETGKYIAGLVATIASLTATKSALEKESNISSGYSAKDELELIQVFQQLNINVNEGEIKQVLDNGITRYDILKFYNLFNREDKDVRDKLANTFLKEWILDGVSYNDLDKFLNLPYSEEFSDGGYAPMFLGSPRYAWGVNARLLTKHYNIKDMIYLSESKNLNLQYIYMIMDLVNKKQINIDDIKNMDKDSLSEFCEQQFNKSESSKKLLFFMEEHLFRHPYSQIEWNKILGEVEDMQKYNVDNPRDVLLKLMEEEERKFYEHPEEFI